MKLVDILARELKEWPEGYKGVVTQDPDKEVRFECTALDFYATELTVDAGKNYGEGHGVTRSEWEAERAKLSKPNGGKDGWIRHRGGKCPVEAGTLVDVRFRSGIIKTVCDSLSFRWSHSGAMGDIMAYRLHTPSEQPATVKAEQVQCEPTELALLREYRASAMAFSLAHGPYVSLPAFDKAEKRLEAAEKACHDFYAGRTPSLPAAGSAVEEVDIPNISYALRERLLGQLAGDHEPEEMLCVEDFYSWLAKAIDNIRAEYRKAEGSKPVQVYASAALSAQQSAPVCWVNDQQLLLCGKSPREVEPGNPMRDGLPRNIAGSALPTEYCNTPLYRVAQQSAHVSVPRELLQELVAHIEDSTCTHDSTHRGGAIWEICDDCGDKWADDRGGKPAFKWPGCVEMARALLNGGEA